MIDGISDLLTQIRNSSKAKKGEVSLPYSTVKESILEVLKRVGFIGKFATTGEGVKKELVVLLKYDEEGSSVILGSRRVSRPGCRKYVSSKSILPVASGLGVSVISTPKGVMTNSEATEQNLGGEVLFEIW